MSKAKPDTSKPLGISQGAVVQMLGWDEDCDAALRDAVVAACGSAVVPEDYDDVVDNVLLWWREDDGDLIDGLLDAITMLADDGSVWLLTPKPGRDGHVESEDIAESAPTAGLRITANISAGSDWQGTRFLPRS
ncbi:MAG: DUF3052 domain-containing protein [Actinomycetia bacterium]|nr:DUF3052 domain-containing protein [Actinomycetes bacterium]